jgi:hypothetical protein
MMLYVDAVCKIGKGEETCRYLTIGEGRFYCARLTSLAKALDARADGGEGAKGRGCVGRQPAERLDGALPYVDPDEKLAFRLRLIGQDRTTYFVAADKGHISLPRSEVGYDEGDFYIPRWLATQKGLI